MRRASIAVTLGDEAMRTIVAEVGIRGWNDLMERMFVANVIAATNKGGEPPAPAQVFLLFKIRASVAPFPGLDTRFAEFADECVSDPPHLRCVRLEALVEAMVQGS